MTKNKNIKLKIFVLIICFIIAIVLWMLGKWAIFLALQKPFAIFWQDFIYPLPIGLILFIFMIIKTRTNKNQNSLASSKWMDKKTFNKEFNGYSWSSDNPEAGFVVETEFSNKKKDLNYKVSKNAGHAIVIGCTRSGKTSMLVNPNIQTLAKAGANMIISDPKGELFNTHSKSLKKAGYEVLSLNLRDYKKSSRWNPLAKIWDLWHFETDDEHIKEIKTDEALGSLKELSAILFPTAKNENPIWTQGASTIFQFMVVGMLEYSEYDDSVKKQHFNLSNILANLNISTYDHLTAFADLLEVLAKDAGRQMSRALMIGGRNIRGAEDTTAGMISNAIVALSIYGDATIKRITSEDEIRITDEKKQAIFLIVPDEDKSKNAFISLFVSETYKELISLATSREDGKLKRPLYYILDEFGNIPKIPNMDSMVTVSASRNIFFDIIIQNLQQIDSVYGKEIGSTIQNNCAYQYYLMTADNATAEIVSKRLGEYEIEQTSHSSSMNGNGPGNSSTSISKRTRRLLDPNELMKLQMGQVIIMTIRNEPIRTTLAPFWEFKEFDRGPMEIEEKPMTNYDQKHIYKFIETDDDDADDNSEVQNLEREEKSQITEEVSSPDHKIDL